MKEKGFIALMSAVIIGAVLLISIVGAGLLGFYSRFNALDYELKERSYSTAEACANEAILRIANDPVYAGGTLIQLNDLDSCRIGPLSGVATKSFKIQATSSDAVTNVAVTVDATNLSISSWLEIPSY